MEEKNKEDNIDYVSTERLIDELRRRGFIVSGRKAGIKY